MNKISFLQHTYTSSERVGEYGTYQYSRALSPDFIQKLDKLGHYTAPNNLPSNPQGRENEYPIAFYQSVVEGKNVFCRTQYIGRDRHSRTGRMGNYFAHSLVQTDNTPLSIWQLLDEINWQKGISSNEKPLIIESYDELPPFDNNPKTSQYLDETRLFLAQEPNRSGKLAEMIDKIIEGSRFVIIDKPDNLLMWVKVLSLALPPQLVQKLSFSSYHFNPVRTAFNIVGMTPDNDYDESDLISGGFSIIKGNSVSLRAYAKTMVTILKSANKDNYDTFIAHFQYFPHISDELNTETADFEILQKYETNFISLQEFKTDINDFPHLKTLLENALSNEIYLAWAAISLKQDNSVATFKRFFNSSKLNAIPHARQSLLVDFYNKKSLYSSAFYEILVNHKEELADSDIIQQIQVWQNRRAAIDVDSWRSAIKSAESIFFPRRTLLYDLYSEILLDGHLSAVTQKRKLSVIFSFITLSI